MSRQYRAEQVIEINGWDCGTEFELKMAVSFTVHPGCKQTMIDPAEPGTVEIGAIRFFDGKDEVNLPSAFVDRFANSENFNDWIMQEAIEADEIAQDDAADHQREMMREGR